jgi:phosphatidylglycerophosphatase A
LTTLADASPIQPSWRFVFSHPAHFIAFGFGSGLSPFAPGTVGTLLAWPLFWILSPRLPPVMLLGLIAALFAAGIWACGATGRALGQSDHGGMVWDEIVAFMLVLFFTPPGVVWQIVAFVLFRFFDIVKPAPIRRIDRTIRGGFGVMFDDAIAAFYTLLVMALATRILG